MDYGQINDLPTPQLYKFKKQIIRNIWAIWRFESMNVMQKWILSWCGQALHNRNLLCTNVTNVPRTKTSTWSLNCLLITVDYRFKGMGFTWNSLFASWQFDIANTRTKRVYSLQRIYKIKLIYATHSSTSGEKDYTQRPQRHFTNRGYILYGHTCAKDSHSSAFPTFIHQLDPWKSKLSHAYLQIETAIIHWLSLIETINKCQLLPNNFSLQSSFHMVTSSNWNIFRVTGPLSGEFIGHRWIPLTKASGAELWCYLWSAPE